MSLSDLLSHSQKVTMSRWTALLKVERSKLAAKESDWNLPGNINGVVTTSNTRTRHGGLGRPNLERRQQLFDLSMTGEPDASASSSSSTSNGEWCMSGTELEGTEDSLLKKPPPTRVIASSSSSTSNGEWCMSATESEGTEDSLLKKPPPTRVIMDINAVKTTLEENCFCKQCDGPVEVSLRTTCLASRIMMSCKNRRCGFIYYSPPPAEVQVERNDNRVRNTDYAINILFVLGFISCGDGSVEASRILGLLGLPNDTTMETRSFLVIEDQISAPIQELTKQILLENLIEEARLLMLNNEAQDKNDFQQWKHSVERRQRLCSFKGQVPLSYTFL
jgi:hypothetical protein